MFTPDSLRQIIRISLRPLTASKHPLYSVDSEEMLLMIAAHESHMGKYLRQLGNGPARGVFQIEPETMHDNYDNFLRVRHELSEQVAAISGCPVPDVEQLQYNPVYGTIHARLKLYRCKGSLPPASDPQAMAAYCKEHFNSAQGAATPGDYLDAYRRIVVS